MHTEMWFPPRHRRETSPRCAVAGAVVLEPASGRLTGADQRCGAGFPEPEEITTLAKLLLERSDALPHDLAGVKGARHRWRYS